MPGLMGIDIETYSSAPLPRCGVYRYCDAPDFEILLFSYAFDDEPVQTIDLARGETLPKEVISALEDPDIIKVAYNAQFERVCLSRYLGHWLDPHQWRCTMVMAAYLTLPGRLADAAVALGTTEKKMEEDLRSDRQPHVSYSAGEHRQGQSELRVSSERQTGYPQLWLRRRCRRAEGHGREDARGRNAAAGRRMACRKSQYWGVLERAGPCGEDGYPKENLRPRR